MGQAGHQVIYHHRLIEGDWRQHGNVNSTLRRRGRRRVTDITRQLHSLTHSPPPGRVEHVLVALLHPEDEKAAHHDGQHHNT